VETAEGPYGVLFSENGPQRKLSPKDHWPDVPKITWNPQFSEGTLDLRLLFRAVWPEEPDLAGLGKRFGLDFQEGDPWGKAEALGRLFLLALEETRSWSFEGRAALSQVLPKNFLLPPKPRIHYPSVKTLGEAFFRLRERGFQPRKLQEEYAALVANALEKGETLLLEAGPGTGKTFGYLIPILLALKKGGRAVVATRTRTLQDQLWKRDLPKLEEILGIYPKRALLKGRENYVCLQRLYELELKLVPKEILVPLSVFAARGGDLDELGFAEEWIIEEIRDRPWRCRGTRCRVWEKCPSRKAREAARKAELVITNHALLGADLAMENALLGPYDFLVVDEAHALPAALQEAMGIEITPRELSLILSELRPMEEELGNKAEEARVLHRAFWEEVRRHLKTGRIRLKSEDLKALRLASEPLLSSLSALAEILQQKEENELASAICAYVQNLKSVLFPPSEDWVPWADEEVALGLTPLALAEKLSEDFWPNIRAAVLTSATLSVNKKPDFLLQRLGLSLDTPFFSWPSPFSYENVRIAILSYLPEPDDPQYPQALAETVRRALSRAPVKAMVLFTSKRALEQVHAHLTGLPHLAQGWDGERDQLLRRFRQMPPPAVLLGLESFWEGVDLPGKELELLVVARLPFPHPGDPVLEAEAARIKAQGKSDFQELFLPMAVLKLRQGLGRLVRTPEDRGVILIADRRLSSRSYKKVFLSSFPLAPRFLESPEELDVVLSEVFR